MKYNEKFIDLVNTSNEKSNLFYKEGLNVNTPNKNYIGYGNPNSKILIIGKEKGFDPCNTSQLKAESIDNVRQWKFLIDNDIYNCNYIFDETFTYENLPLYKNPIIPYCQIRRGGHTWSKYNKLVNYILKDEFIKEHEQFNGLKRDLMNTSFLLNSFITEFNVIPSKLSPGSPEIQERISFLKHSFFMEFKIIILACGNYISPTNIKEMFNVDSLDLKLESVKGQKMDFYSNDNKIVVNTRQLSFDVYDEYLTKIALLINENILK